MLKTIVQQHDVGVVCLYRPLCRGNAVTADDHRAREIPRQHDRLVAHVVGSDRNFAARSDQGDVAFASAIAAQHDRDPAPARL